MEDNTKSNDYVLWVIVILSYVAFYLCKTRRRRTYIMNNLERRSQHFYNNRNDENYVDGVRIPIEYQNRFHANPEQRKEFILNRIITQNVEMFDNKNGINNSIVEKNKKIHNSKTNSNIKKVESQEQTKEQSNENGDRQNTDEQEQENNNTSYCNNDDTKEDDEKRHQLQHITQSMFDSIKSIFTSNKDSNNAHSSTTEKDHNLDDSEEIHHHHHDNLCAICFTEYEEGQKICSSKNLDCEHSFHFSCMAEWLMKHDECPICRQDYLKETDIVVSRQSSFEDDIDLDEIEEGRSGGSSRSRAPRNASFRYYFSSGNDSDRRDNVNEIGG